MCELAVSPSPQGLPPFILENRDHWCRLDAQAKQRAAAFPFVLVDIRFGDDGWWQKVGETPPATTADVAPSNSILGRLHENLMLETLLFARQLAREDGQAARMMLAMTSPVVARVASLSMQQVRTIALGCIEHLQVRWAHDPDFWREVLIACRRADDKALDVLRHHAKLLFCGEIIRRSVPKP